MKTDREKLIDTLTGLYTERDFYKHLAEELIKEKKQRIRKDKGVITYGQDMFTYDTIGSEVEEQDEEEFYEGAGVEGIDIDVANVSVCIAQRLIVRIVSLGMRSA